MRLINIERAEVTIALDTDDCAVLAAVCTQALDHAHDAWALREARPDFPHPTTVGALIALFQSAACATAAQWFLTGQEAHDFSLTAVRRAVPLLHQDDPPA